MYRSTRDGIRRFPKGDRKALWSPRRAKYPLDTVCRRISPSAEGDQGFAAALDLRGASNEPLKKED